MSELHSAARDGNLERLTQLLAAGQAADSPDHINRTPLHLAAFAGRVRMLLFKSCRQTCTGSAPVLASSPLIKDD